MDPSEDEYRLSEFKTLLMDPLFVDIFNVFLSLPVFGQKLFYRLNEKRFECDPPINRDSFYLDQSYLHQWLKIYRLPIFEKSTLNSMYRLSLHLCRTQIIIIDIDRNKILSNELFLCKSIGSAVGVRNMRWYLKGTMGYNVLNLWFAIDSLFIANKLTPDQKTITDFYKTICEKYMHPGSMFELAEDVKWRAFTDMRSHKLRQVHGSTLSLEKAGIFGGNPPGRITASKLHRLKNVALEALQRYWLPRYVLHMHSLCVKSFGRAKVLNWVESNMRELSGFNLYDGSDELINELNIIKQQETTTDTATTDPSQDVKKFPVLVGIEGSYGPGGTRRGSMSSPGWNRLKETMKIGSYSPKWLNMARRPTIIEPTVTQLDVVGGKTQTTDRDTSPRDGTGSNRPSSTTHKTHHVHSVNTAKKEKHVTSVVSSETGIESASSSQTVGSSQDPTTRSDEGVNTVELMTSSEPGDGVVSVDLNNEIMSYHDEIFSNILLTDKDSEKLNTKYIPKNLRIKWKKVLRLSLTKENIALIQKHERQNGINPVPRPVFPILPTETGRNSLNKTNGLRHHRGRIQTNDHNSNRHTASNYLRFNDEIFTRINVSNLPPVGSKFGDKKEERRKRVSSRLRKIRTRSAIPRVNLFLPRDCEFRFQNKDTILAVACDRVSGGYLSSQLTDTNSIHHYLNFWLDSQHYLVDGCRVEEARSKKRVVLLATNIVNTYLNNNSTQQIVLSKVVGTLLGRFLPTGEADMMLAYAQDEAVAVLKPAVGRVWYSDIELFREHTLVKRRRQLSMKQAGYLPHVRDAGNLPPRKLNATFCQPHSELSIHEFRPSTQNILQESGFDISTMILPRQRRVETAVVGGSHAVMDTQTRSPTIPRVHGYMEPTEWIEDKRSHVAFSLVYDVCNLGYTLGKMCIDVSSLFSDTAEDDGSLKCERRPIVRSYKPRCGKALAACAVREYPRSGYHADSPDDDDGVERTDDNRPMYLKPIRKNGRIVHRPLRPRHFHEIMRDNMQLEFFKRFLIYHCEEAPILFWLAIESMRTKDTLKARQQKAQNIIKKYFSKAAGKGEILRCNADVIKEIPKMSTVTPAMLYSAQACVARTIEERWFLSYIETFPEEEEFPDSWAEEEGTRHEPEFMSQDRTAKLWQIFIHGVTSFRRGIMSPFTSKLFQKYLLRECEKQAQENEEAAKLTGRRHTPKKAQAPASIPTGTGVGLGYLVEKAQSVESVASVKQLINNRVVYMDRLDKDLSFWAEVERYKDLADSASKAVASGTYSLEDQDLLQMKALAIINCYLDSQVHPKVQVNISDELADIIVSSVHAGMFERGLFHDAALTIFNILIFYWKRFYREQFALKVKNSQDLVDAAIEVKRTKTPDFNNLSTPVKRYVVSHDDCTHMVFTMLQGLRLYVPLPRANSPKSLAFKDIADKMFKKRQDLGHSFQKHPSIGQIDRAEITTAHA